MRYRVLASLTLVIVAMITVTSVFAQETPSVTDDLLTQFEQRITDEMAYFHIPGMAVAVVANGEIVYANGFGVRDQENDLPFTSETLFRIGSTTKSMTSLMIAQLVAEGLLSWDTPVTEILPDFATADPALTAQITLRDLMGMATGLESDAIAGFQWGEWAVADLLQAVSEQAIRGEFRDHYAYNNEVYAVAGYVGAVAAGLDPTLESYQALMQARVFDPISMTSAIITDDHSVLGDNFAQPYEIPLDANGFENVVMSDPPIGIASPSGAVWTNVQDMARYLITQMNGGVTPEGERIVDESALMETWTPGVSMPIGLPGAMSGNYGMGWVTMEYYDIPVRWHDGGWSGYSTQMVAFPDANIGLILFANSNLGSNINFALTLQFAEMLYGLEPQASALMHQQFDEMVGQLDMVRTMLTTPFDAETAAAFTGTYEGGWTVAVGDDSLTLSAGVWEFRALPLEMDGVYLVVNGGAAGVPIAFAAQGDQTTMTIQLPDGEITFNRVSP